MTRRILLDVDGVLANFAQMCVNWVNKMSVLRCRLYQTAHVKHCTTWDLLEALGVKHLQDAFDAHCNAERVARNLNFYPGARQFYADLCQLGEVVIVTSPYKAAATWECDRRAWLKEWFGIDPNNVVFTSRKELVVGDILIDDGPHNIDAFPGPAVLVERPWNHAHINKTGRQRYRTSNLDDVVDAVRTEFNRQEDRDLAEQERQELLASCGG